MNDTQMGDWMRSLPRAKASPGFTSEVLRETRRDERVARRIPFVWRMAAAMAMTACLVAVVQIALVQHARREKYETLRAEQARLEADLAAVKKIAEETEPVVVFENDSGTRVIMDLDSAIQPASLRTFD
jgi:hypothetical protein